jgi:uncharacterized protein YbjT (DUF2867 family)
MKDRAYQMEKILVAGATGYLGEHLVKHLRNRGFWVRALARPDKSVDFADEIFHGSATSPTTLKGVCDGIDTVFSSLGITRQTEKVTYMDVDYGANANVLAEALSAGVERFGLVSVVNPQLFADNPMVQAREEFVRELTNANIKSTIVRATGFFSDMADLWEMAQKGTIYLFDQGRHESNPIHGEDLAEAFVDSLENEIEEISVGGPDVLSARKIAELAFKSLGSRPKIRVIPSWVQTTGLALIRPFNRRLYDIGTFMRIGFTNDMLGTQTGVHHLKDHFNELVNGAKRR